jgi:hypothetical protein
MSQPIVSMQRHYHQSVQFMTTGGGAISFGDVTAAAAVWVGACGGTPSRLFIIIRIDDDDEEEDAKGSWQAIAAAAAADDVATGGGAVAAAVATTSAYYSATTFMKAELAGVAVSHPSSW